jgi:hypothetical protein
MTALDPARDHRRAPALIDRIGPVHLLHRNEVFAALAIMVE